VNLIVRRGEAYRVAALDKGSVLEWLRSLPVEEFAHLLVEACLWRAYPIYENSEVQYLAAQAIRDGDGPWTVALIAREDWARYQGTPYADGFPTDHGIIFEGVCQGCGQRVCSWAQWVRCPVCGAAVTCS
jgi:hypothetical protein